VLAAPDVPAFDAATLLRRLFAVHLAIRIPADGVLKVGSFAQAQLTATDDWIPACADLVDLRFTLHWALGGTVRSTPGLFDALTEAYRWESRRCAVVAPLSALVDRLASLNTYDTITIGDLPLDDRFHVLVPADAADVPVRCRVARYEPARTSLSAAALRLITDLGGWVIASPGTGHIGAPSYLEGEQVNCEEFFRPLIRERPYPSFGIHSASELGSAYHYGGLDRSFSVLLGCYYRRKSLPVPTGFLETKYRIAKRSVQEVRRLLLAYSLAPALQRSLLDRLDEGERWLATIHADLSRRRLRGRTFAGAHSDHVRRIVDARNDESELERVLEELEQELPRCDPERGGNLGLVEEFIASLPPEEMESCLPEGPSLQPMLFLHLVLRWKLLGERRAREEDLPRRLSDTFERIHSGPLRREVLLGIFRVLGHALRSDSTRLRDALSLLRLPRIRHGLDEALGMRFEGDEPRSLQIVLRAHPTTRAIFDASCRGATRRHSIARLLRSFPEAYGYAASLAVNRPRPGA
jgi:hypothetical protein